MKTMFHCWLIVPAHNNILFSSGRTQTRDREREKGKKVRGVAGLLHAKLWLYITFMTFTISS